MCTGSHWGIVRISHNHLRGSDLHSSFCNQAILSGRWIAATCCGLPLRHHRPGREQHAGSLRFPCRHTPRTGSRTSLAHSGQDSYHFKTKQCSGSPLVVRYLPGQAGIPFLFSQAHHPLTEAVYVVVVWGGYYYPFLGGSNSSRLTDVSLDERSASAL